MKVTLFGKVIFEDVTNLRILRRENPDQIIQVGLKSKQQRSLLDTHKREDRHRKEGDVKMKAKVRVWWLQAKEAGNQ